jgi:hypothetical protein
MTGQELDQAFEYFNQPTMQVYIEAEIAHSSRLRFEEEYAGLTNNSPLPIQTDEKPYFVLDSTADKWGIELRIYFIDDNIPNFLDAISTSNTRPGYEAYNRRINKNELINYLFSRGFRLGAQD